MSPKYTSLIVKCDWIRTILWMITQTKALCLSRCSKIKMSLCSYAIYFNWWSHHMREMNVLDGRWNNKQSFKQTKNTFTSRQSIIPYFYVEGSGPMFAFSGMWDSHVNCSCAQSTKVYHMNVHLTIWTKRHYMNWLRIFHFLNHISVFILDGYVVLLNINKILQQWIPRVALVYQIVIASITIYM